MKKIKSLLYILLTAITMAFAFSSCDKVDENGDFGGFWLLSSATTPEETLTWSGDNYDITWGVRNNLIQLHYLVNPAVTYNFTFTRTENSLQFEQGWFNDGSNDFPISISTMEYNTTAADGTILPHAIPAVYRVPLGGHFDIVSFSSKEMVLRAGDAVYTFKKH